MTMNGELLKIWKKTIVTFLQSSLIRQEGLGKTKNKLGQDSQWGF
jgi:hypothetical protein